MKTPSRSRTLRRGTPETGVFRLAGVRDSQKERSRPNRSASVVVRDFIAGGSVARSTVGTLRRTDEPMVLAGMRRTARWCTQRSQRCETQAGRTGNELTYPPTCSATRAANKRKFNQISNIWLPIQNPQPLIAAIVTESYS